MIDYEAIARQYIDGRRSMLWAQFNLYETNSRERAVEWVAELLRETDALRPTPKLQMIGPPYHAGGHPFPGEVRDPLPYTGTGFQPRPSRHRIQVERNKDAGL